MTGKLTYRVFISPEEAANFKDIQTLQDISICMQIEKTYLEQNTHSNLQWQHYRVLAAIWRAGWIHGVRTERDKKRKFKRQTY